LQRWSLSFRKSKAKIQIWIKSGPVNVELY
jgi:hypothetical protein